MGVITSSMPFAGLIPLLALLASHDSIPATPESIPKGQLIQNVSSQSDTSQRFTVYLPTRYDPSRPAPIVYLLDPRGRALVAAKLFQPAAERYGYILMSSHNSASDSPGEVNLRAMQAMWHDANDLFAIDERRVYVAGFSGTARMASLMAQNLPDSITGVIGSAAGYASDVRPSNDSKFLYFGTVGDADYNFHEMESLERSLVSLNLPHRVERFQGSHSWMPPHLAMRAIEWMELRAMQSGRRPPAPELIATWWTQEEDIAQAALAAGRHVEAARRFSAMARDFAGLRDTAHALAHAARMGATPSYEAELKRRQRDGRVSSEWLRQAMVAIAGAFPRGADAPERSLSDLTHALELAPMKQLRAGPRAEVALEAQRRLNELEAQLGFYLPAEALEAGHLRRARYYLSAALEIDDQSPVSWYFLGRTRALQNEKSGALAALRRAFQAGFRGLDVLEADPAFERMRADKDYAAIVAQLRDSGDVLDVLTVDRPPAFLPLR